MNNSTEIKKGTVDLGKLNNSVENNFCNLIISINIINVAKLI